MEKEKKISQISIEKCPECKSTNLITDYDTGEVACGDCGLVLPVPMIDKGPEWRAYTQDEEAERSRVGMPETFTIHDKSLSTTLKPIYRDPFGRAIRPGTLIEMKRLSKWQEHLRVHSSIEKNLTRAMTELDRLADKLNISAKSPLRENAAVTYRKILDKRLIRGRSINGMVPACLYAACRETGTPRTLQEVADASLVDKKEVARCYRLLLHKLDIQMPVADSNKCVSKIGEKLGISGKTQGRAVEILRQAKEKKYGAGKDPMSIAAAALYIACLENNEKRKIRGSWHPITQRDIAEVADITEVTIRNRYKNLVKILDIKPPTRSEKIALFYFSPITLDKINIGAIIRSIRIR
jgi:transcription initiation factor TFIIB